MPIPPIEKELLRSLCKILGDDILTGGKIGQLLLENGVPDPLSKSTKRDRLFEALNQKQQHDRCANKVIAVIQQAMSPVCYVDSMDDFERHRSKLNEVLAFAGLQLCEDGKIVDSKPVTTLRQASQRADELRIILHDRNVHADVLRFCREELLVNNYFHAVFEATKSIAEKIRKRTGLATDGSDLVDTAFSFNNHIPYLALNALKNESEKSEQKGFINLLKGLFGAFRNTTAHAPKITWPIDKQDALDILSLVSLVHRRIDQAVDARFTCNLNSRKNCS